MPNRDLPKLVGTSTTPTMDIPAEAFGTPGARGILHIIPQFQRGAITRPLKRHRRQLSGAMPTGNSHTLAHAPATASDLWRLYSGNANRPGSLVACGGLVWFTVSGTLFGHVNGKDWTLRGFLAAERGR
jgi:hypothetical protein